jgi:type I restriction enzyme S subunit
MVRELKHTKIGDIPVDWELQTFDETFRVLSNNTLSRENLNNRGGAVRNIHYGDILTKFPEVLDCKEEIPYVNDLSLLSSSTQLLQDGDIVIADTAEDETVGKVTEVQNLGDSKLVAGLHTIPCRVIKGDFAPGWLGYYMNSNLFHNQILPYITGIKVSSISKGAISETLILVPPFDEQEKIVQSLNEVQLLMTAETKVVNKMKFVKNGCLSKMFPKNDATVPEMRLPGFTGAWEQRKFSEFTWNAGKRNKEDLDLEPYAITNEHGFIKQSEAHDDFGYMKDTDRKAYNIVMPNSFAYNPARINVGSIGYYEGTENVIVSSLYEVFQTADYVDDRFLWHWFKSDEFPKWIERLQEGSVRLYFYYDKLCECQMLMPSVPEQKKIAEALDNLDNLITLHQRKCDKYSSIKKGMMSDLLTGKIRLV